MPVQRRYCIPASWKPLCPPGSILYDSMGNEYVIVRRVIGSKYLVVPKYASRRLGLRRIIKGYAAGEVVAAGHLLGVLKECSIYGTKAPLVDIEREWWMCCPSFGEHALRLLAEVLDTTAYLAGRPECVGITGSLLAGHWSPRYSDIDVLVDTGPACLETLRELLNSLTRFPLPTPMRRRWVEEEAKRRGLASLLLEKIPPFWQRTYLNGRTVSLAPVYVEARLAEEKRVFIPSREWGFTRLCIDGFLPEAGDYPAVLGVDAQNCIVVYDGFYAARLLEGGCFEAKGPRVHVVEGGQRLRSCISVGGREGGLLRPVAGSRRDFLR